MRVEGWTPLEIAADLKVTPEKVRSTIVDCLAQAATDLDETVEQNRQLQNQRLDMIVKAHMPIATTTHKTSMIDRRTGQEVIVERPPDTGAASIILQTEARRAKLHALDSPEVKRVEVSAIREYVGVPVDKV